jgi:hypothetical protein
MSSAFDICASFVMLASFAVFLLPAVIPLSVAQGASLSLGASVFLAVLSFVAKNKKIKLLLLYTWAAEVATGFTYLLTPSVCGDLVSVASVFVLQLAMLSTVVPMIKIK